MMRQFRLKIKKLLLLFDQPIIYNLNDDVIKSFSKKNVNLLIENIIESLTDYPREYLFINSNDEEYTEDRLKKMLKDITKDKILGLIHCVLLMYHIISIN